MPISKVSEAGLSSGAQFNGFKNRIINGGMDIDQRNAGASVTVNNNAIFYSVDRFFGAGQATDGVFTLQQDSIAPSGFIKSLKATVTTADSSLGAMDRYVIVQRIEGTNVSDLAWGTAAASTVTLSFWVRSSVTGIFSGTVVNSAGNRSYPFTYSISTANTWEYKSVMIPGDTTGTWLTDTGIGVAIGFCLGAGASVSGTAGAWAASNFNSATGATNLMATLNATFYITGVQLEKGSTATSFDYRPYGTELALCQRYFISTRNSSQNGMMLVTGEAVSTSRMVFSGVQFPVVMRSAPTTTVYSSGVDTSGAVTLYNGINSAVGSGFTVGASNAQGLYNRVDGSASLTAGSFYSFSYEASAEL